MIVKKMGHARERGDRHGVKMCIDGLIIIIFLLNIIGCYFNIENLPIHNSMVVILRYTFGRWNLVRFFPLIDTR